MGVPPFEIVLRFADGREEVRITDRPPDIGRGLEVSGRTWTVLGRHSPSRYVCQLDHGAPVADGRLDAEPLLEDGAGQLGGGVPLGEVEDEV